MASSDDFAKAFVQFGSASVLGAPLVPKDAKVETFAHPPLRERELPTYNQIKSSFKAETVAKAARFCLSDLVSDQLSVEVEEQRRFERKVKEEVDNRLAILRREAQDAGFKEGSDRGRSEAFDAEKVRLAALMEMTASAAQAMGQAKHDLATHYEKMLVEMSFRLAELVVHTEIKTRPEVIYHTVSAILERVARDEDVRVRLSASDFEAVDKVRAQVEDMGRVGRISFDVDSSIKPGDCVVESSSGEIASFVDDKLKKLKGEMFTSLSMKLAETGT